MQPLPTYQCREATITNAVKAAINSTSACAPVDATSVITTISPCAGEMPIWLAWINQIQAAFCYIFGKLTGIQTEINGIIPARVPGNISIVVGAASGGGATAFIQGNDTAGTISIVPGTSPLDHGLLFTLTFAKPYTTPPTLMLIQYNDATDPSVYLPPVTNSTINGATAFPNSSAFPSGLQLIWGYIFAGGT